MHQFTLPDLDRFEAWRDQARACANACVPACSVSWRTGTDAPALFTDTVPPLPEKNGKPVRAPKGFLDLARLVCAHESGEAFNLLYRLLIRMQGYPCLLSDRSDPDVETARRIEKSVRRDMHKMKAFVRFREFAVHGELAGRRRFFAWFEPSHNIVQLAGPFFARRFADMDWVIATPRVTAIYENENLRFDASPANRPDLTDQTEELWKTYFTHIFNPARLKVKAMCAEMPKKYWKNLPEAETIPLLIREAESRSLVMRDTAPTPVPPKAERVKARLRQTLDPEHCAGDAAMTSKPSIEELRKDAAACTRCRLCEMATQTVFGEGPEDAGLMVVGEQPGDREDLAGKPFIGPAGQLFDRIARSVGLDRSECYVTNAVKHFKFRPAGKRRIHQRPENHEIDTCRWWLDREVEATDPKLILAMGATALRALTGNATGILRRRGAIEQSRYGIPVFVTVHPSFVLRLPNENDRAVEEARFAADLAAALDFMRQGRILQSE